MSTSSNDNEQLYYVQDSRTYSGNCIMWWGKDRNGYVINLDNAGLYTAEELAWMRETDVGWPKEFVEKHVVRHVDAQPIHREWGKRVVGGARRKI